jgi:hypothetical protein
VTRPGARRVLRAVLAATGLSVVLAALGWLAIGYFAYEVPIGQLWALSLGLMLAWRLLGSVAAPATEAPPPAPVADAAPARPFAQAERWQRRLSTTDRDPEWYARVVRDRIAGLVDERLRQRHQLRLDSPAARPALGEELYAFLTAPLLRTPNPAELGRLLIRIEEI